MSFEEAESVEKDPVQQNIESMISNSPSREAVAEKLAGIAWMHKTIHDPETNNDLDTDRVAQAIKRGDPAALADEVPKWLLRKLRDEGLLGE